MGSGCMLQRSCVSYSAPSSPPWHVVLGVTFMTQAHSRFFFSGSSYSYGVIQAKLEKDGVGSAATLAFVGSMSSAALSIFAIPNSALIRRFGARKVLIAGGLITGLGEILASFAVNSIPGLFITFGAVAGAGFSMIYLVRALSSNQ